MVATVTVSPGVSWLDPILVLLVIGAILIGIWRGLIKTTGSILFFYVGLVIAGGLIKPAAAVIRIFFSDTPSNVIESVAFFLVLILVLVALNLLQRYLFRNLSLGRMQLLNRIGGGIMGAVLGVLAIVVVLNAMDASLKQPWESKGPLKGFAGMQSALAETRHRSILAPGFVSATPNLVQAVRIWFPAGPPKIFDL